MPLRSSLPLRTLLRQLARSATATSTGAALVAGSLAACGGIAVVDGGDLVSRPADGGGGGGDGGIDPARYTTSVCTGTEYRPLDGVTPARATDSLSLRSEMDYEQAEPNPPAVLASTGTPCATATDKAACSTKLAALRSKDGWRPSQNGFASGDMVPTRRYLVYTRGDEVGTVTSLEALRAFFAPAENPKDAALLATEHGHRIVCSANNARATDAAGTELLTETGLACGAGTKVEQHRVQVAQDGTVTILESVTTQVGDSLCAIGRRPEGFRCSAPGATSTLAAHFEECAELEAASVHAFEHLARELRAHGAPEALARRAEAAAADEVRHARTTARLAARFGGTPRFPALRALDVRSLETLALENATEGCVRETFGALVATVQAERAGDEGVRRAMQTIAEDETRHAELAWDLHAWLEERLDDAARARLADAQRAALAELERALAAPPAAELVQRAGVLTAPEALHALAGFRLAVAA